MSGKLRVLQTLGNPKSIKRKKAKRRAPLKRSRTKKRAARSISFKWVVRIITMGGHARWWGGTKWVDTREKAKLYSTQMAASDALRKTGLQPNAWLVADIMLA